MRELVEPEKSVVLNSWKQYAKQDGGEKFVESIQILNDMVGVVCEHEASKPGGGGDEAIL